VVLDKNKYNTTQQQQQQQQQHQQRKQRRAGADTHSHWREKMMLSLLCKFFFKKEGVLSSTLLKLISDR
jgi:hypothetical protein